MLILLGKSWTFFFLLSPTRAISWAIWALKGPFLGLCWFTWTSGVRKGPKTICWEFPFAFALWELVLSTYFLYSWLLMIPLLMGVFDWSFAIYSAGPVLFESFVHFACSICVETRLLIFYFWGWDRGQLYFECCSSSLSIPLPWSHHRKGSEL